jgi:cGMP-dependent protein kinase
MEYCLEDLSEVGVLGSGAFGRVSLVEHKETGETYALKAVSKGYILERNQQTCIMAEKAVLRMVNSPYVVRLVATFNSQEYLYFLMEPALGGELFTLYAFNSSLYGSATHARFYVACAGRALEYLHTRSIIYRDLKPENVLLDARGYAKITDFGMARLLTGHAFTVCGTPEYFAPELFTGAGYTMAIDWWCLGVLAFELMMGAPPFTAAVTSGISRNVKRGIEAVKMPRGAPWTDLVTCLLQNKPADRLAMRPRGFKNVEEHRWFRRECCGQAAFDWNELDRRDMKAPHQPQVDSSRDIANFVPAAVIPPVAPYVPPKDDLDWDTEFEDVIGPVQFAL